MRRDGLVLYLLKNIMLHTFSCDINTILLNQVKYLIRGLVKFINQESKFSN